MRSAACCRLACANTVFVVPADVDAARAAFRHLRIRATDGGTYEVDAHGITPGNALGRGTPAHLFYLTIGAFRKLAAAGLIDPDRYIGGE